MYIEKTGYVLTNEADLYEIVRIVQKLDGIVETDQIAQIKVYCELEIINALKGTYLDAQEVMDAQECDTIIFYID